MDEDAPKFTEPFEKVLGELAPEKRAIIDAEFKSVAAKRRKGVAAPAPGANQDLLEQAKAIGHLIKVGEADKAKTQG